MDVFYLVLCFHLRFQLGFLIPVLIAAAMSKATRCLKDSSYAENELPSAPTTYDYHTCGTSYHRWCLHSQYRVSRGVQHPERGFSLFFPHINLDLPLLKQGCAGTFASLVSEHIYRHVAVKGVLP